MIVGIFSTVTKVVKDHAHTLGLGTPHKRNTGRVSNANYVMVYILVVIMAVFFEQSFEHTNMWL